MAKSVEQIRQQIARLQEQEQALLQKEIAGVVGRIRAAVTHYGITADQIFGSSSQAKLGGGKVAGAGKVSVKAATPKKLASKPKAAPAAEGKGDVPAVNRFGKGVKLPVRFRDDSGNTWSGRGSQPRWLRSAVESGRTVDDFLVG